MPVVRYRRSAPMRSTTSIAGGRSARSTRHTLIDDAPKSTATTAVTGLLPGRPEAMAVAGARHCLGATPEAIAVAWPCYCLGRGGRPAARLAHASLEPGGHRVGAPGRDCRVSVADGPVGGQRVEGGAVAAAGLGHQRADVAAVGPVQHLGGAGGVVGVLGGGQ